MTGITPGYFIQDPTKDIDPTKSKSKSPLLYTGHIGVDRAEFDITLASCAFRDRLLLLLLLIP